jgi:hypothetical protein
MVPRLSAQVEEILICLACQTDDELEPEPITYYALDLNPDRLVRSITALQDKIGSQISGKIALKGMCGTCADMIRVIQTKEIDLDPEIPVNFLLLGDTTSHFKKGDSDVAFLKSLPLDAERGDMLVLCLDKVVSFGVVEQMHTTFPVIKPWVKEGLHSAGRLFGNDALFRPADWEVEQQYNENLGGSQSLNAMIHF